MSWQDNLFIRPICIRPRLFLGAVAGLLMITLLSLTHSVGVSTRLLLGWNTGVWVYLGLVGVMMARSSSTQLRARAEQEDEGQWTILCMVIVAALASIGAIVAELGVVKDLAASAKLLHIALVGATIFSSWAFTHMMFALHYAHDYYLVQEGQLQGGLSFPGDLSPAYADFVYFAFVIGTSGQTADVSFTTPAMRRIGLLHCVLAFLFNTTLLALMINIAASLI